MDPRSLVGQVFDGKYRIDSIAGSGGMGTVYRAQQLDLDRTVAIKLLHEDLLQNDEWKQRFEREAQALARISHRNIGMFYSFAVYRDTVPYIVMEYVSGKSLGSVLATNEKLSWQRTILIARQLTEAMTHIHANGILHRDLSPNNIFILDDNGSDLVKLLDFGLSKILLPGSKEVQKLTQTGALMGSIHYMSPELCSGHSTDFRSDIYSLSCVLYECLTGRPPHEADNPVGLMHKHVTEEVKAPSATGVFLPPGFDEVVLKGLAKDPAKRYQTMTHLNEELNMVANNNGVNTVAVAEINKSPAIAAGTARKYWAGFAIFSVSALAAASAFFWFSLTGLDLLSKFFLSGSIDKTKLQVLQKIGDREEQLGGIPAAFDLRKRVFEHLDTQRGTTRKFFFAHETAMHYQTLKRGPEASYWAWQGIRQLSQISAETIRREQARLLKSINDLCTICEKGTSPQSMSPKQMEETRGRLERLNISDSTNLTKLQLYLLRRLPPGLELARCLTDLSRKEVESKQAKLALQHIREVMSIPGFQSFEPMERCSMYLSFAYTLNLNGLRKEAIENLDNCRKIIMETPATDALRRGYVTGALDLDYPEGLNSILDVIIQSSAQDDNSDVFWACGELEHCLKFPALAQKILKILDHDMANRQLSQQESTILESTLPGFIERCEDASCLPMLEKIIEPRIALAQQLNLPSSKLHWSRTLAKIRKTQGKSLEAFQIEKNILLEVEPVSKDKAELAGFWANLCVSAKQLGLRREVSNAIDKACGMGSRSQKVGFLEHWVNHQIQEVCPQQMVAIAEELLKTSKKETIPEQMHIWRINGRLARGMRNFSLAEESFSKAVALFSPEFPPTEKDYSQFELFTLYRDTRQEKKLDAIVDQIKKANRLSDTVCQIKADLLIEQQRFAEARKWLNQPLNSKDPTSRLDAAQKLIYMYNKEGDKKSAEAVFKKHVEFGIKNNLEYHAFFQWMFERYKELSLSPKQKEDLFHLEEKLYKQSLSPETTAEAKLFWSFNLANYYLGKNDVPQGMELQQALELQAKALKDSRMLAVRNFDKYKEYWARHCDSVAWTHNWTEMKQAVDEGLSCVQDKEKKMLMLSSALHNACWLARIELKLLEPWAKALAEYAEKTTSDAYVANTAFDSLSDFAYWNNDMARFEKYRAKQLTLNTDKYTRAHVWLDIGNSRRDRNCEGVEDAFEHSLKLLEPKRDEDFRRRLLLGLCETTSKQADNAKTTDYLKSLLEFSSPPFPPAWRAETLLSVAQIHIKLKEPQLAEKYLKEALNLYKENRKEPGYFIWLRQTAERYNKNGYKDEAAALLKKTEDLEKAS